MSKKYSTVICALYCVLVLSLSALLFFLPKEDFSPKENRILAKMPRLSAENLIDGRFSEDFSSFCADRFPFRASMLTLNSSFELGLGKLEARGVMSGADKSLIKRLEYNNYERLKENLSVIDEIREYAQSKGKKAVFFCAPRAVDVLGGYCHPLFDTQKSKEVWEHVKDAETITEALSHKAEQGEYVFYKTDHHWTTLGAYYTYVRLGKLLGYSPYPLSDFTLETVSNDFYGTTYSSCLLPDVSPDKITAFRYEGDEEISVTDTSTQKVSGLYDFSVLDTSSKYDFFLGGNRAHLKIKSGKPRLTVIKDSFANSLLPFLARHYDIDVIDPRYLREPLENFLADIFSDEEPSDVLILFGVDTLMGNTGL